MAKRMLRDFLLKEIDGETCLIGSRCSKCGEIAFPARSVCTCCCTDEHLEDLPMGTRGKLYSYTETLRPVSQLPAPVTVLQVEMENGLRVIAPLKKEDEHKQELKAGMPMELSIEELWQEEDGTSVIGYRFGIRKEAGNA